MRTGGIFYFPWPGPGPELGPGIVIDTGQIESVKGPTAFLVSPPKDTGKAGKRNFQSSEAKFSAMGFEPGRDRPVTSPSQCSNTLGPSTPTVLIISTNTLLCLSLCCLM